MPDADRNEIELAAILDRLTDSTIEHRPSLDELTAEHPHLADELRELWGTIMVIDAVAQHSHANGESRVRHRQRHFRERGFLAQGDHCGHKLRSDKQNA